MDIKTKSLIVIEGMLLAVDGTDDDEFLGACYKFAHVGLGYCRNSHDDWVKEMEETYQKLIDNGIIGSKWIKLNIPLWCV